MAKARKMNRGITGLNKEHPDTSPKLVTISLGHIIKNRIFMEAYCGSNGSGWRYGNVSDSNCSSCVELFRAEEEALAATKKK